MADANFIHAQGDQLREGLAGDDFNKGPCNSNVDPSLIKVAPRWKHKKLNEIERVNFIELYRISEKKYPIYTLIASSQYTMYLWVLYIATFGEYAIQINQDRHILTNLIMFCLGVMGLQFLFEATHVGAHASFLEYDEHHPQSQRIDERPIYYLAFYHHHHHRKDDWAPMLSYNDNLNQFIFYHQGTRNVIASHWHGFSFLSSSRLIIIWLIVAIYPLSAMYFFGYEVGVIMLPLAHGWQHIPKKRFGFIIRPIFNCLEFCHLIASKHDHNRHHVHTTPEVYQDFSSSGFLYSPYKDRLINAIWKKAFYAPNMRPSDWLKTKVLFFCLEDRYDEGL